MILLVAMIVLMLPIVPVMLMLMVVHFDKIAVIDERINGRFKKPGPYASNSHGR